MAKYKVWASVYIGNGQREEEEYIEELDENSETFDRDIDYILWDMLHNLGVETGWEKIEE